MYVFLNDNALLQKIQALKRKEFEVYVKKKKYASNGIAFQHHSRQRTSCLSLLVLKR